MILFKRVSESFNRIEGREWALLFLETVGVVAGILVAFELNEWAARRHSAANHRQLMERLLEESETDVAMLRDWRDRMTSILKPEQAFALSLARGQCPADRDFKAVQTLHLMPALTVPTSVYQELMGAGGLSSIDRKDVREHVARFHDTLAWTQGQVDYFRATRVTPVNEGDARVRIRFDPTADDPKVMTFDGPALCRDPAFENRVAAATREHTVFVSYYQGALEDAISMCMRLADSIGKTCMPSDGGPLKGDDADYAGKVVANMREDLAKS
jgi:hypothetical protein